MRHSIIINTLAELPCAAKTFLKEIGNSSIVALYAPMGAGKTTFTTAVCKALGVGEDAISSPTFSIVNEYRSACGDPIFHFDFYRIAKIEEALDIGFYDYVDSGCLCIMEWPENIEELLPEETLKVFIDERPDGSRCVHWEDQNA